MKMNSNETSFAVLKSIISKGVDAYEVRSTINFPGSRFSDFAGKLHAQKLNKAQIKRVDITGMQYFYGIWYCLRAHQQEWCQLFLIVYPLFITLPHNLRQLPF